MSDDLIQRLREMSRGGHWPLLGYEAADRIEADAQRIADLHSAYAHSQEQFLAATQKIEADEALMRQALEALDLTAWHDLPSAWEQKLDAAIAALRARLGESKT